MSFGLDKSPPLIQIAMNDGLVTSPLDRWRGYSETVAALSRTIFNLPEQERKTGFRLVVPINKRSLFKDKVR